MDAVRLVQKSRVLDFILNSKSGVMDEVLNPLVRVRKNILSLKISNENDNHRGWDHGVGYKPRIVLKHDMHCRHAHQRSIS